MDARSRKAAEANASVIVASALVFSQRNVGDFIREIGLDDQEAPIFQAHLEALTATAVRQSIRLVGEHMAAELTAYLQSEGNQHG